MFVYQGSFNTLVLKEANGTDYVISWKSKWIYTSKLTLLYTDFLHNIKLTGYSIGIQFYSSLLLVEQMNHATKFVNAYIVYDSYTWAKISFNNFKSKNC